MKAMIRLGHHEGNAGPLVASCQPDLHPQFTRHQLPEGTDFFFDGVIRCGLPLHPLEENIFIAVKVLISMQYIAPTLMNPASRPRYQSGLIRAMKQGDDRQAHDG
jgi:hypothetical protein